MPFSYPIVSGQSKCGYTFDDKMLSKVRECMVFGS